MTERRGCPYDTLPAAAFWSRSVGKRASVEVDPLVVAPFALSPGDKVATAGSCFAQHIARHIRASGFTYLVTEDCMRFVPGAVRARFNYGTFSARFGNIYTPRQLFQLIERAYGRFVPREVAWAEGGGVLDPFRPQIQPGGFASVAELEEDRRHHFAAVRRMFETCDVFVFTLGLTETWEDLRDGAVFPICPGCGGGEFSAERYAFRNLDYIEVMEDMQAFIAALRAVNPAVRILLTVSPVPLVATASGDQVLTATTYSKSVLRAAAGRLAQTVPRLAYFPSYEIITGNHSRGAYFAPDLRSVTEAGVSQVMSVFFRHFYGVERRPGAAGPAAAPPATPEASASRADADYLRSVRVICDEEVLEQG